MPADTVLEALGHDRARVDLILKRLSSTGDHTERADLAAELVKSCSRYEDVKERVLYPALEARPTLEAAVNRARLDQEQVRRLLAEMRERTKRISPRDVHALDPLGVDLQIDRLAAAVSRHLHQEETELLPALDELDPATSEELAERLVRAVDTAVEHPQPPGHKLGRKLADLVSRADHMIADAPTESHPGRDRLPPQDPPA